MNKVFKHSNFSKLSTTLVFGIALFAILKILFFDSLFEKTSFGMRVFLSIMLGALFIVILYAILDIWIERIIIYHNKIVYKGFLGKKEVFNSNIKGFFKDGQHSIIYALDESVIIVFDNRLKNEEKITSYLEKNFNSLDKEV